MRIRFRLRALLIATMIIAVCLGVAMTAIRRANEQRRFCELVRTSDGTVKFPYFAFDLGGEIVCAGDESKEGFLARRLIRYFGTEGWGTVTHLTLGPHMDDNATREILCLASKYPSIQAVAFDGQTISSDIIERLNQLPQIRDLTLRRCELVECDLALLNLPDLQNLVIHEIDTSGWSWTFLSTLPQPLSIDVLRSTIDSSKLARAMSRRALARLQLIGVDVVGDVSAILGIRCHSLAVYDMPVTDDDLSGIAANTRLRRLGLQETGVTDQCLDRLVGLPLEHLDLSHTWIGDAATPKIARMTSLESLELEGTRISDDGLASIARLKNLRSLTVSTSIRITRQDLERLQALLPACRIEHVRLNGGIGWIGQDKGT